MWGFWAGRFCSFPQEIRKKLVTNVFSSWRVTLREAFNNSKSDPCTVNQKNKASAIAEFKRKFYLTITMRQQWNWGLLQRSKGPNSNFERKKILPSSTSLVTFFLPLTGLKLVTKLFLSIISIKQMFFQQIWIVQSKDSHLKIRKVVKFLG
jgi:hypothetical protein